jgi:hypothetical protein
MAHGSRGSIWRCPTGACRAAFACQELRLRPLGEEIARGARPPTGRVLSLRATGSTISSIEWVCPIRVGIAGLPLMPRLCYIHVSPGGPARSVAAVIDDIERLTSSQRAAYEKCDSGFDWSDRGRTLRNAVREALDRQAPARTRNLRDLQTTYDP